jgi:predicted RND superfamily exporter protein
MIGLCQILLSFPLAYFVYYFFGGIVFFPFLNFIGIFVVFALGADDVFVAVDKWKSARRELPHATTEQVAALALPDAAYSMLLTSLTTAVAFFGTAICPVGPIVCFAVFCGLLITLDYALCLFLVFPALCLYDRWRLAGSPNCCVDLGCGRRPDGWGEDAAGDEERVADASPSLMHRVLDGYYVFLHQFRWLVLALVVAGTAFSLYVALQISLPVSSEVALLPDSNEYSKHMEWRNKLLSNQLLRGENRALVVWGVSAVRLPLPCPAPWCGISFRRHILVPRRCVGAAAARGHRRPPRSQHLHHPRPR